MICKDRHTDQVLEEWPDENNTPPRYLIEQKWPNGRITHEIRYHEPELSDNEIAMVEYHQKPAHPDTIMKYLLELAAHKHLKGDERQQTFLLNEFVTELMGATELQLFFANNYFKTEVEDSFFPQLSTYKKQCFYKM